MGFRSSYHFYYLELSAFTNPRMQKEKRTGNVATPHIVRSFSSAITYLSSLRSHKHLGRRNTGIDRIKLKLRSLIASVACGEPVPIGNLTVESRKLENERKYGKYGENLENIEVKPRPSPQPEMPPIFFRRPKCFHSMRRAQTGPNVLENSINLAESSTVGLSNLQLSPPASPRPEPGSVSTVGVVSPMPNLSFSPIDKDDSVKSHQILRIFHELKESEHSFITSMKLVTRYFVEPCLMRCLNLSTTCTPLVTLKSHVEELIDRHERLLATMRQNCLDNTLSAIEQLLTNSCYPEYSGTVKFVVYLMQVKVVPFELTFLSQIARFLEKCQPYPRKQDLSVLLLLQTPIARIAQYPLFFSSMLLILRSNPKLAHSLETICVKLTDIDMRIGAENVKLDTIDQMGQNIDYYEKVHKIAHSFGPLTYRGDFVAVTVHCVGWKKFHTHLILAHVLCHQYHLVVTEIAKKTASNPTIRFIVPFSHCHVTENVVGCVRGLTCSGNFATKIAFYNNGLWYEILLVSVEEKRHGHFLQNLRHIAGIPTRYKNKSGSDCFVDSRNGIFDTDRLVEDGRCYVGQVFNVDIGQTFEQLR